MRSKTVSKLILDITMALLFTVLIYPRTTGMSFHEIAGLAIALLMIIHLSLNWAWIKAITRNFFKPGLKAKSRWFYILDIFSLLAVIVIVVTGIEISLVLFPSTRVENRSLLYTLHKWISYGCLGLLAVHAALHWNFIVNTARKLLPSRPWPKLGKAATALASVALILGLVYVQPLSPLDTDQEQVYRRESQAYPDQSTVSLNTVQEQPKAVSKGARRHGRTYDSSISSAVPAPSQPEKQIVKSPYSSATDTMSLADYLDNLFCTGCEKRCSLLKPECGIGVQQAQAATQKYQQTYGADK